MADSGAPKRQHLDPNTYFGDKANFTAFGLLNQLYDMDPDSLFEAAFEAYDPGTAHYRGLQARHVDQYNEWKGDINTNATTAVIGALKERSRREVEEEILPRAEQGFRDAGSANTIGLNVMRGIIWGKHTQSTNELDAQITLQRHSERQAQRHQHAMAGYELEKIGHGYDQLRAEVAFKRAGFQMTSKETLAKIADGIFADSVSFKMKANAILDEEALVAKKWKAESMRYYSEMIASISGGIPIRPAEELSTTRAAVGGAIGGAGAAVSAGQPWWAGALVGGFLSAVGN